MPGCEHCGQDHQQQDRFCPSTGKLMASRLLAAGTVLENKYRIVRLVGAGGMGAVFEADHLLLEKRVAVKVILPQQAGFDDQLSQRLLREARAAAATGHPNIAAVTDVGCAAEGSYFVVMEYLEGKTLKQLVEQDGPMQPGCALEIMAQVLAGLDAVHRKGIVHRDLKPENIMMVRDEAGEEMAKILDFGLSKADVPGDNLTRDGLVIGTPQFMSPEQIEACHAVDTRTDIYSSGAILYFILTGTTPFTAETLSELLRATLNGAIDPPSSRRPGISPELDRIVLTAMARFPDDRFADARDFRAALQSCLQPLSPPTTLRSSSATLPSSSAVAMLDEALDEGALVALDERDSDRPSLPAMEAGQNVSAQPAPSEPMESQPTVSLPAEPLELEDGDYAPTSASPLELQQPAPLQPPRDAVALRSTIYGQARKPGTRAGIGITIVVAVCLGGGALAWWLMAGAKRDKEPVGREQVRVSFKVNPAYADVRVDGVLVPERWILLARSQRQYSVKVSATGHTTRILTVSAETDAEVPIILEPAKQDSSAVTPPAVPHKRPHRRAKRR